MGVPVVYRKNAESSITSYNYTDIANGAGYVLFYPCASYSTSTAKYFLSTEAISANPAYTNYSVTNAGVTTSEADFDVVFERPTTLAGSYAVMNLSDLVTNYSSAYFIVNIYHVDKAGVETLLGTETSNTYTSTGGDTTTRHCLKIALTQKNFRVGESLRVNIQSKGIKSTAGSSSVTWYHNPADSTTNAKIYIPFRIDL